MNGKIVFRIFAGLVLLAAIAGIAFLAFNLGAVQHTQLQMNGGAQAPAPYAGYGYWRLLPFLGFGCLAPLMAIFLLFLAIRAFSFLFWGPRFGHRHMHRGWGRGEMEEGHVPPMFQEWHRRAHAEPSAEKKE